MGIWILISSSLKFAFDWFVRIASSAERLIVEERGVKEILLTKPAGVSKVLNSTLSSER